MGVDFDKVPDARPPAGKVGNILAATGLRYGQTGPSEACDKNTITLKSRKKRVITPITGVQRAVIMAIERGKLQNLIFDNRVLFSHRALSAVLGSILKLSPVKKALAKQQLKSAYANTVIN